MRCFTNMNCSFWWELRGEKSNHFGPQIILESGMLLYEFKVCISFLGMLKQNIMTLFA